MLVRHKIYGQGYKFTETLDHDKDGVPRASRIPGEWMSAQAAEQHLIWCRRNDKNPYTREAR